MKKCLGCYKPLKEAAHYHQTCSKKLFGFALPPLVDFGFDDLEELAKKSISQHLTVPGVQPKISLHLSKHSDGPKNRLMIVDLWGNFILKPPTRQFPDMSIVEDVTMHMAQVSGIPTAQHGLIKLNSGELAYITKRFDRTPKKAKIAVEDFCQLSELLTESKYATSLEKAGKIILKYSSQPGLDAVSFFTLNVFCFLTGNADMHLKNFSLMQNKFADVVLAPAYDLLSTKLMPIDDKEESALTINGKKAKLKRKDFLAFGQSLHLSDKVMENALNKLLNQIPKMKEVVRVSFLSGKLKTRYSDLIDKGAKVLAS